ncbi:MAG: hypothetical protein ABT19_04930 [Rhodanobacter sp. SCN 68-63]|nr:MAG: hypothetical protein ABT19_04930 [Rhodanobacter sp. SCN 68-63]
MSNALWHFTQGDISMYMEMTVGMDGSSAMAFHSAVSSPWAQALATSTPLTLNGIRMRLLPKTLSTSPLPLTYTTKEQHDAAPMPLMPPLLLGCATSRFFCRHARTVPFALFTS